MNIKIENPYGEHDQVMTLYRDNEHVCDIHINGSNDCPETLLEYLEEFDISPHRLGIKETGYLDNEPDFDNDTNIVWIVK